MGLDGLILTELSESAKKKAGEPSDELPEVDEATVGNLDEEVCAPHNIFFFLVRLFRHGTTPADLSYRPGRHMPPSLKLPETRPTGQRITTEQLTCMERLSCASPIRCSTPTGQPATMLCRSGRRWSRTPVLRLLWTVDTSRPSTGEPLPTST